MMMMITATTAVIITAKQLSSSNNNSTATHKTTSTTVAATTTAKQLTQQYQRPQQQHQNRMNHKIECHCYTILSSLLLFNSNQRSFQYHCIHQCCFPIGQDHSHFNLDGFAVLLQNILGHESNAPYKHYTCTKEALYNTDILHPTCTTQTLYKLVQL